MLLVSDAIDHHTKINTVKMASNITDSKYNYMTEPEDDLLCIICLELAEEPWQHGECGRLLCKKCLNKLGRKKPCPNCREENPKYFNDNRSKIRHTITLQSLRSA